MTDKEEQFEDQTNQEGFPEEILRAADELEVSAGFVQSCYLRVLADQEQISAEAEHVDEVQIPAELLASYRTPEPSLDFVSKLEARVQADRNWRQSEWRQLLRKFSTPEPSSSFVDRTLAALGQQSGSIHTRPGLWQGRMLTAAAALLLAFGLQWSLSLSRLEPIAPASAQDLSPVFWGTSLQRQSESGVRFEAPDALQIFIRQNSRGGDD